MRHPLFFCSAKQNRYRPLNQQSETERRIIGVRCDRGSRPTTTTEEVTLASGGDPSVRTVHGGRCRPRSLCFIASGGVIRVSRLGSPFATVAEVDSLAVAEAPRFAPEVVARFLKDWASVIKSPNRSVEEKGESWVW